MSEADHQAALMRWARTQEAMRPELKLLYAVPNGAAFGGSGEDRKGARITGWKAKQQGLKPGVPDLCLPVARGGDHGLYIEMKNDKPKGVLTNEQKAWIGALLEQDYAAVVCYGWDEARAVIEQYLAKELETA